VVVVAIPKEAHIGDQEVAVLVECSQVQLLLLHKVTLLLLGLVEHQILMGVIPLLAQSLRLLVAARAAMRVVVAVEMAVLAVVKVDTVGQ
jgi:hypothetical protein